MTSFDARSSRAKRPCPIWVDAFQRDTQHLEADEVGAYFLILMAMWTRETCDFPDDDHRLARVSRVSLRLWRSRVGVAIKPFFMSGEGVLLSKRLREEAAYVERQVQAQSDRKNAEKSGNSLEHNEPASSTDEPWVNRGAIHPNNLQEDNYTGHIADEAHANDAAAPPVSEPDHKSLSRYLVEAGGNALANPAASPGLLVLSDPINWIRNGCDLHADILPIIRARCSSARPSSIRSWRFFTEAVFQARDNRLKPAPEPNLDRQAHPPRRAAPTAHDNFIAALARTAARASGDIGPDCDFAPEPDRGRTIDLVANRQ